MELREGDLVLVPASGKLGRVEYISDSYVRVNFSSGLPTGRWGYAHREDLIVIPKHSTEQQIEALRRLYASV